MRLLILILARGGSQRLPGKNVKLLRGIPLISHAIRFAKKLNKSKHVLVTTNDRRIARISKKERALVPWLRPKNLSGNNTSSEKSAIHALNWYEKKFTKVDGLLSIQPTNPFRKILTYNKGINIFRKNNFLPVVGVSLFNKKLIHFVKVKKKKINYIIKKKNKKNFSLIKNLYKINGSFYLISPKDLRNKKSFAPNNSIPLIINSMDESLDIDDRNDWNLAKLISKNQ